MADEATADALRFLIGPLKDLVVEVHRLNELLAEHGWTEGENGDRDADKV